ncbi:hypothetical protein QW180_22880 [Vibrio sinaloensis]|nr:hypothetical protein [Vibrio sinaloensis]
MGALEYTPALADTNKKKQDESIKLDSLVAMAQLVLDERNNLDETITNEQAAEQALTGILQVGTSAGGARAKAVIAVNSDHTQIRSGQVNAPQRLRTLPIKV